MLESGARLFHMRIPPDAADRPSGTRASTEAIKVGLGAECVQRAPYNGRPRRAEVAAKGRSYFLAPDGANAPLLKMSEAFA
jgi:hypothetical protein